MLDSAILKRWPRGEKIAHKDIKMRTFITQEKSRAQLVSHVYDLTYGAVGPEDVLVAIDDSIVRGTTLKNPFCASWDAPIPGKSSSLPPLRKSGIRTAMESTCPNWATSSPSRPQSP